MYSGGDLVDVLTAGALGPDRAQLNLIVRKCQVCGDIEHR
jgi:hypothetical protein